MAVSNVLPYANIYYKL